MFHPVSRLFLLAICLLSSSLISAATGDSILPMKQRAETIDRLLAARLETLPAKLMRREGVAMWVLVAREYNEDPVVMTMLPGDAHAARRRTILVLPMKAVKVLEAMRCPDTASVIFSNRCGIQNNSPINGKRYLI